MASLERVGQKEHQSTHEESSLQTHLYYSDSSTVTSPGCFAQLSFKKVVECVLHEAIKRGSECELLGLQNKNGVVRLQSDSNRAPKLKVFLALSQNRSWNLVFALSQFRSFRIKKTGTI